MNNPRKFKSIEDMNNLLHCKVDISLVNGKSEVGWVYTIDPMTHSFVLYQPQTSDKPRRLSIIFCHSVKEFAMLEEAQDEVVKAMDRLGRSGSEQQYTEEELSKRKMDVKGWLERNRLPVRESEGRLKIADALEIDPPYTPDSCRSNNEIILSRVQAILRSQTGLVS